MFYSQIPLKLDEDKFRSLELEEEEEKEDIMSCQPGYNVDNYAEFLAAKLMNRLAPYISESDVNYV